MKILKEFRDFAVKGNAVDLATAVIIGGAFGKIVSSLVADIIMPLIGVLLGGVNFTDIKFILKNAILNAEGAIIKPEVTFNIGNFIQNTVDFLIIAWAIFILIRMIKKFNLTAAIAPTQTLTKQEQLLTEIRDLLKEKENTKEQPKN